MTITTGILKEFKDRMRLGDDEDENLLLILETSYEALRGDCGNYEITHKRFNELVFERSRYVYNDALEFFSDNFLTETNNLRINKALESITVEGDVDAKV
jgi:hypothetical protein